MQRTWWPEAGTIVTGPYSDVITWIVIYNSLDIDFMHRDIHCRSCKNIGYNIDGLAQERHNSDALAKELHLSCINPAILFCTVYLMVFGAMVALFGSPFLPEASFGLRVLSLPASVRPSVRPSVTKFVRAITQYPFKLGLPNLNQRCLRPWLRSLLFCGTIDCDLQGQIELQSQNLPHFELVHAITRHQLKLQFPNLEQKCILALFRSLPILGLIEVDLQFNF